MLPQGVSPRLNPLFKSKFSSEHFAIVKNWFWARSKMAANVLEAERPSWKCSHIPFLTIKSNSMENPDLFRYFKRLIMRFRTSSMRFTSFVKFCYILYIYSQNWNFWTSCIRCNFWTTERTAMKFCKSAYFQVI